MPVAKPNYSGEYHLADLPMIDPHLLVDYLFKEVGLNIPEEVVRNYWHQKKTAGAGGLGLEIAGGRDLRADLPLW